MITHMSATEARVHFGEVLRRVENNETIIVERNGKPTAVILSIQEYERLKSRATMRRDSTDNLVMSAHDHYPQEAMDV